MHVAVAVVVVVVETLKNVERRRGASRQTRALPRRSFWKHPFSIHREQKIYTDLVYLKQSVRQNHSQRGH